LFAERAKSVPGRDRIEARLSSTERTDRGPATRETARRAAREHWTQGHRARAADERVGHGMLWHALTEQIAENP